MSETNSPNQTEKAAKIRRKPEQESVLSPTFAAARQVSGNDRHQSQSPGSGLLQRQCSCGKHTIAGGMCEECQKKGESASPMSPDAVEATSSPAIQTFPNHPPRSDFSAIPARTITTSSQQILQSALTVNAPGDQYEQEADRVAKTVMRMPASFQLPWHGLNSFLNSPASRLPSISRVQTGGNGAFQAPPHIEARINQMQGSGQPLPDAERNFFETRMGYDFSGVRVHTDANAVQASRDIQAHAFTIGPNIAFNKGSYQPQTEAGRHLLAHELTHVVQQGAAKVQRKSTPSRLIETTPKSQVLSHLQTLPQKPDFDTSLYRKEITEFQQINSADKIAVQQQQILPAQEGVDIRQRDNSRTLRRCGGGGQQAPKETVDPKEAIKKAAESLVEIGGTANDSDKAVVVAELIKIPLPALTALKKKGTKVVVCRNSVTEIRTDLKGVKPRGWPPGSSWDTVPGLNDRASNRVIIATRNGRVPPKGDGHGAHNLVLHEVGHAIGDALGSASGGEDDPKFIAAREKDKARLDSYEGQAGKAGVEETYAESFARFYGKDPNDATAYPNLHAYWAGNPFISESK